MSTYILNSIKLNSIQHSFFQVSYEISQVHIITVVFYRHSKIIVVIQTKVTARLITLQARKA